MLSKKIVLCALLLSSIGINVALAANKGRTKFVINGHQIIANLKLKDVYVITAEDISNAIKGQDKSIALGSFCAFTNHPHKKLNIRIRSQDGQYALVGEKGTDVSKEKVSYKIAINGLNVPYNKLTLVSSNGGSNHAQCKGFEENIVLTIPAANLQKSKSGSYLANLEILTR